MTKLFTTAMQTIAGLAIAVIGLSGCSDFKQAIGSEKSVPDEFEVVVRPPLSLPPGFGARPTDDGAQEQIIVTSSSISARDQTISLLGTSTGDAEGYDDIFAFDTIPDNIRNLVDEETTGIRFERRLPFQIVFGGLPEVGPILNQMQEDVRLRTNRLQGKLPTEGATPATDGVEGTQLQIQ